MVTGDGFGRGLPERVLDIARGAVPPLTRCTATLPAEGPLGRLAIETSVVEKRWAGKTSSTVERLRSSTCQGAVEGGQPRAAERTTRIPSPNLTPEGN
jgi:hypothetical protein